MEGPESPGGSGLFCFWKHAPHAPRGWVTVGPVSKRDNHWYILDAVVQAVGKSLRPRAAHFVLWLFLVAAFVVAYKAGALDWASQRENTTTAIVIFAGGLFIGALALGLVLGRTRQSRYRTRYLKALASPTPEPLIQVAEAATAGMKALPDGDALAAHELAFTYALYGREAEALRVLAGVSWEKRAPLIRGAGLNAEGMVALLCRRDARRALELTRQARALATMASAVPGAAQSERFHNTCVALAEAILDTGPSTTVSRLEEGAADERFPVLQLLATLGLAIAMERAGNTARAEQLRTFLRQTAPHCEPLHLKAEDFTAESTDAPPPVVAAAAPVADDLASAAKRRLLKKVGRLLGTWAVLVVLYALFYAFFSQPK